MARSKRIEPYFLDKFEGRTKFLIVAIICAFGFLIFNFWQVQVMQGKWFLELSLNNRVRKLLITAPRGTIYDSKGVILADTRPSFDVEVIIEDIPKQHKDEIAATLGAILNMPKETVLSKIQISHLVPYVPEKIKTDIDIAQVTKIEELTDKFPGITIRPVPVRAYRFGSHVSHVLGYIGKLSPDEYKILKEDGYSLNDVIGKMGIEKTMESYLKGTHGGMQVQVDHRGYTDKILGIKEPVPGNNVYLTIDHHLQEKVESIMKDKTGAVIVIDPRNGNALTMASFPQFDPNIFVKPTNSNTIHDLFTDEKKYLVNKAIRGRYPAGSTFKMLVATAGLETGGLNLATRYSCNGKFFFGILKFRCWFPSGHGAVNVVEALRYSCNVFFYNLGHRLLGVNDIHMWADRFGFGEKTGIELDYEDTGINPSNEWKKMTHGEPWYPGDTINLSIGQGYILITPLQLACYGCALATGGILMKPRIVDKIVSCDGKIIKSFPTVTRSKIKMSPETIKIIQQGMTEVVQHRYGTGIKARVPGITVAGKTGTIQMGYKNGKQITHGWFLGVAPMESPEIVVVVLVEHALSGGSVAAPLASEIMKFYFKNRPGYPTPTDNTALKEPG